jgi:purine-binding chemotaxis protein CheW
MEQFVLFRLGDEQYGLPVAAVDEVVRHPDRLTPIPNAPAFIEGMMNLRGFPLPVINQKQRFAVADGALPARRRIVVVTIDGLRAGFTVDGASTVVDVPHENLAAAPALSDPDTPFTRVATLPNGGRMILLVDPAVLVDGAQRDMLAALAAQTAIAPAPTALIPTASAP